MNTPALLQSDLPGLPVRRGKVRDVYDLGDRLLIVATDRISAFDWILPTGIPDKGRILTRISAMWFERLDVPHHLLSTDVSDPALPLDDDRSSLTGRSMIVRKARVAPIECVARGYLAGSGWKEYQHSGSVCGQPLPAGLVNCERLPEPIFTPATKAEAGHDENISFAEMCKVVGEKTATTLQEKTLSLYADASAYAESRGLILADTKFEFGETEDGNLILIDEALTPDSSRYWPADEYRPGSNPPSFDKQFVRDWLDASGWDKNSPPPALPDSVVQRTREKYLEAFRRLVGVEYDAA
ncbi:MAG: phosphoribosylaminoimidazolesuccinocarboxamide synthase [Planctomycetota bacterium]|nr:phosphoribosylaminoimidazolesuccinocarboxamide synthase [Planctomycetaceae bacterium]MDQ3329589.1 phosphoribosylaminoimidazolesuccinocarboxamide synthase [Planctomycetota bacterium]